MSTRSSVNSKIVVIGGTGFLGRHITRALLDAGHDVTVATRDPSKVGSIKLLLGANAARCDVTDPATLIGLLEGATAVVYVIGFPNYPMEQPRKGLTFDRYERGGIEHVLAEARRSGTPRLVYLSGVGADPFSDKSWYRAKGRAEEAITRSGLTYAIVRPSWAYGPEDVALNKFRAIARYSPIVPKPGVRPQLIQPVYVKDIALAVQRIFERSDAWDRVYEIGGPEVMSMDEVVKTMLDVMGKRGFVLPIPAPLAKLGTAPLALLPKPPMTPGGIDFAIQDGLADNTELRKVLEVEPVPLRDGLMHYMAG